MNRQEKESTILLLRDKMASSAATFLVGYRGLSVAQLQTLRTNLRSQGAEFKVAKARLMKKAIEGVNGFNDMTPYCKDQVGLVFADAEISGTAKVLKDFAKENDKLDIVVGNVDAQVLGKDAVLRIASLPSKEILLAQVCGTLNAPIAGLARVLHTLVVRPLWVLKKIEEKK